MLDTYVCVTWLGHSVSNGSGVRWKCKLELCAVQPLSDSLHSANDLITHPLLSKSSLVLHLYSELTHLTLILMSMFVEHIKSPKHTIMIAVLV